MRGSLLWPLAVLLLAGCSGSPSSGSGAQGTDSATAAPNMGQDAETQLLAPNWHVGDWWTLESAQSLSGPFTHVVSGEAGDDWIVDTDSREIAFFNARSDISFLGHVRKADIAGSQGSARVEFLKFPLKAHENWTTTWDGQPVTIHVTQVKEGRATLTATRASGAKYADYTYDSKPGYFTHFVFYDAKGKDVGYEWKLSSSGAAFGGNLVRWSLQELFALKGALPPSQTGTFNVEPGITDVWVEGAINCTQGMYVIAVGPFTGPAANRGYSSTGPCPKVDAASYALPAPAATEQWGIFVSSAPVATTATAEVHIYARTATEFQAGKAPS